MQGGESVQLQFDFRGVGSEANRSTHPAVTNLPSCAAASERAGSATDAELPRQEADPEREAARWYELGRELESGDAAEARKAYRRALELNPRHAEAHLSLGFLLQTEGCVEEAVAHYRRALRAEPKGALAAFNLGVALEELERPADAVQAYERAIAIDACLADAHYNLAALFESRGDRRGALRHLRAYRELSRLGKRSSMPDR